MFVRLQVTARTKHWCHGARMSLPTSGIVLKWLRAPHNASRSVMTKLNDIICVNYVEELSISRTLKFADDTKHFRISMFRGEKINKITYYICNIIVK